MVSAKHRYADSQSTKSNALLDHLWLPIFCSQIWWVFCSVCLCICFSQDLLFWSVCLSKSQCTLNLILPSKRTFYQDMYDYFSSEKKSTSFPFRRKNCTLYTEDVFFFSYPPKNFGEKSERQYSQCFQAFLHRLYGGRKQCSDFYFLKWLSP